MQQACDLFTQPTKFYSQRDNPYAPPALSNPRTDEDREHAERVSECYERLNRLCKLLTTGFGKDWRYEVVKKFLEGWTDVHRGILIEDGDPDIRLGNIVSFQGIDWRITIQKVGRESDPRFWIKIDTL